MRRPSANGTGIELLTCNGATNQRWSIP